MIAHAGSRSANIAPLAPKSPPPNAPGERACVIIPNWNGLHWLPGLMASLAVQQLAPEAVIVVDNGSRDGSLDYLASEHPEVVVIELGANAGFAHAVNRGLELVTSGYVALLNTDVVLEPDWLARMVAALAGQPDAAAVACKMLQLNDRRLIYDAGNVLRRDSVCEQRGRFSRDLGQFDERGDVFGACAGAALYRVAPLRAIGGFDQRYFAYLEDVDVAVALRLAGWRCLYEPAVALHAGEGSSHQLDGAHHYLVARNTLLLIVKWFPVRWWPLVAYRQISWLAEAGRQRRLRLHLRALRAGIRLARQARPERRARARAAIVPIGVVVPRMPIRGPRAGGHRSQIKSTFAEPGHVRR
jgi:GT2 family glycosyltransferase